MVLGCSSDSLPTSYLGLPLGGPFKLKRIWDPIIEKIDKKLASWKRNTLSRSGRVTLLNSVLSNLPTYFLSLFVIPTGIANKIEAKFKKFFWKSKEESNPMALLKWRDISLPKTHGGLNVKNIKEFNRDLLMKWRWRFATETQSLWRKVIEYKYGSDGGSWVWNEKIDCHGLGLWKAITQETKDFWKGARISIGQGNRTRCWEDHWHSMGQLKNIWPDLYNLSLDAGKNLHDLRNQGNAWNPIFRNRPRGSLADQAVCFLESLSSLHFDSGKEDTITWDGRDRVFSVASCYRLLISSHPQTDPLVVKTIWNRVTPPKAQLNAWRAYRNCLPTMDNLQKKGVQIVNGCPLCLNGPESADHIFISCTLAQFLWSTFLRWSNQNIQLPSSIQSLYQSWNPQGIPKERKKVFLAIPDTIIWTIWVARNNAIFRNSFSSAKKLEMEAFSSLFSWICSRTNDKLFRLSTLHR